MQTIQIDITNACNKRCSNCTRFCGNHNGSFFMDFDTFKRAINSLEGYDGVVGIMGGEPTLHPEFERFITYLKEKTGKQNEKHRLLYPQKEFIKEIRHREFESHVLREREDECDLFKMSGYGLFSNMTLGYRQHYELIQDFFDVQYLNDHINASYHQPGLFSRKDLGIPDEEWIKMRDKCWIQNEWSATITPKGAFFCEIAGALDMLFDGPGGWPIEPGWWKRTPEEFGDQMHWCEICGFALDTFMRDASEEMDDVSPTVYEMLKSVGSPRMKQGKTNLVKIENGVIAEESKASGKHFSEAQPYIEHYEDRFSENNPVLFIHEYEKAVIADGEGFGKELNKALKAAKEWVLFSDKELDENGPEISQINELIKTYVFNPGTMHLGEGYAFFSKKASALKEFGFDRIATLKSFDGLLAIWESQKIVSVDEFLHLEKWKRDSIDSAKTYIVWGTGVAGCSVVDAVINGGASLPFVIDKDPAKEGIVFYGPTIRLPEYLNKYDGEYDYLIIAHYSRFEEIKQQALALGVPEDKIVMPYEI